jgi:epoxide hydrolase-like predicted phosphatase
MALDQQAAAAPPVSARYRGLLVDYGGVLTTHLLDSFRSFCKGEGIDPDAIVHRIRADVACRKLVSALETGGVAESEFEPKFARMLGVKSARLIDRLFAGSGPEPSMLDAVRRARQAGIRTGLISNSWGTRRYDRALLTELFDGIVISGEVGIRKPAPEIYELGARSIGVGADACVFVDDLAFNLKPATELGMATIHHVDPTDTISELERLLEVPLR